MPLDPHHPTLHYAEDLAEGWFVLHHGQANNHKLVSQVTKNEGDVLVTFSDGSTDHWRHNDTIHAAPPVPAPVEGAEYESPAHGDA